MLSRRTLKVSFVALLSAFGLVALAPRAAHAQAAQFDLAGPTLEVKVQRSGKTLPIAEVPNLQPGDRLWLHPVLGEHQSVHYLMVAVFLRGSTNPPPDDWFVKVEAWNKQVMEEGKYILVPPRAEQAVVLFAPQTGGDYSTLKNAVQGRPGSFVRASQDLNVAGRDRARIDTYLRSLRAIDDPDKVKDESNMLARSLSLKVNQDCFARPSDQQAPCLQQNESAMILDNGSTNVTQGLLNGPTSDLALQAGAAPQAAFGYYNSYISSALDIARILENFHNAQYQYIPALADNDGVEMNLKLNSPPSFHNPKSVLVVALPPIEKAQPPMLHPVDPKQVLCMERMPLVLPVDGDPSVFATKFAHGLTLHLQGTNGKAVDLPVQPDPGQGGFVVPTPVLQSAGLGTEVDATVKGFWGFDPYTGPSFKLRSSMAGEWAVADADKNALVVGRDDDLHLRSQAAACVDAVNFTESGKEQKATFKADGTDGIIATLPLKNAQPGPIIVAITQAGSKTPKTLTVNAFAEAGKFDNFNMHAGDRTGVLQGTRLDEVASLDLKGVEFKPGKLSRSGNIDSLEMTVGDPAKGPAVDAIQPGTDVTANIQLKDSRSVQVPVTIAAHRPVITLMNKNVELAPVPQPAPPVSIKLSAPDELPLNGKLTFALKSENPETFSHGESVEVATTDGMASQTFSLASGQLILQDSKTAIGTLSPATNFGTSAFGPLRLRPVMSDGTVGDWTPLATLVRLPQFDGYTCPPDTTQNCTLTGQSLFLLSAVSADQGFTNPVPVPDGFAGNSLSVPRAANGTLYVKLRDNPSVVNPLSVPPPVHIVHHHPHPPVPGAAEPGDTTAPAPAGATGTDSTDPAASSAPAPAGAVATPAPATPPPAAPATTPPAAPQKQR